jgi:hypothetical protein
MILRVIAASGETRDNPREAAENPDNQAGPARASARLEPGHPPRRVGSGRPVQCHKETRRPGWAFALVAALP